MTKCKRSAIAAAMAGVMVICSVFIHAPISAVVESDNEYPVTLEKSNDGTKYEATYELDISDIGAGKTLVLEQDSVDKIGSANLSVSFPEKVFVKAGNEKVQITFTSDGVEAGDYSAEKTITGYTYTDTYEAHVVSELKGFEYSLDDVNKTVTLSKYTGEETDVVIYPEYSINDTVYSTIVAVTSYDTSINDYFDPNYDSEDSNKTEYKKKEGVFVGNKKSPQLHS